jgi:hypothetical protein
MNNQKEQIRKVFLENLVFSKNGKTIKWNESIGKLIRFVYDNIEGYLKIKDVQGKYITVIYNDKEYEIANYHLKECKLGNIIATKTSEFKYEIGTIFKDNKRDIVITDRERKKNEQGQNMKMYRYYCNICGYEEGLIDEYMLSNGTGCSCCASRIIVKGINDISTTNPEWEVYFCNIEDMYTRSFCSTDKIQFKCPNCGEIKSMKILDFYRDGFNCSKCSDGIKYPNKFMIALLKQLSIEFTTEYSPKWIFPRRYDFCFKLNNKEYIIEMDGGLGHGKGNYKNNMTSEESQYIDDEKDKLAIEHNIEKPIRIDCDYGNINSRFEFIKSNVLKSELNSILDLSKVDFKECDLFAGSTSFLLESCKLKRENPSLSPKEISTMIGNISYTAVFNYLKFGNEHNLCIYDGKEEQRKTCSKNGLKANKPIICIDNKIIFHSMLDCDSRSLEILGVKIDYRNISAVCNGKRKSVGGHHFKLVSDLTEQEYIKYDVANKLKQLENVI